MNAIHGYRVIKPDELHWRPSNRMRIPNADFLERTGSELLSVPGCGGFHRSQPTRCINTLVGPQLLRQVFNDTKEETPELDGVI